MRRGEAESERIKALVTGGALGTAGALVPESVGIAPNPTGSDES